MKIRISDRVIVGLIGLLLAAVTVITIAEGLFDVPVTSAVGGVLASRALVSVLITIGVALLTTVAAGWCVAFAIRRNKQADFVQQQAEGGQMSISMKAIEMLVQKCVATHTEVEASNVALQSSRDGLKIDIDLDMGSDVSMPLVVNAVQKQVKQYITACTGVDVKEVRVQVDHIQEQPVDSAFALPETIAIASSLRQTDDKAVHQRLFQAEETPVDLPKPLEPVVMESETEAQPCAEVTETMPEQQEIREEPSAEADAADTEQEPVVVMADDEPVEEPADVPVMEDMPEIADETEDAADPKAFTM